MEAVVSPGARAESHPARAPVQDTLSVPFVVAAAVLIGGGIFLTFSWILDFSSPYFVGVFLLAIGGLMLFSPRAGMDRAP